MVQAFRARVKTPIAGVVRLGRPPSMGRLRLRVNSESRGSYRAEKGQHIMDSGYGNARAVRRILVVWFFGHREKRWMEYNRHNAHQSGIAPTIADMTKFTRRSPGSLRDRSPRPNEAAEEGVIDHDTSQG
jgi:hypothetical protein